MQLSIETNFKDVARQLKTLQADIASKATASALNKTVAQAKTAMSKEIRAEFNLPASTVSQSLRIRRASARAGILALEAELSSISQPGKRSLNLAHFDARQTAKGVSVKIRKGGKRTTIRGAFLINAGATVMIRVGRKRLPIEARQTINISQMFNTKRINAKVVQMIEAKFPTIFANEVRYYTERFNSRGG